MNHNIQYYILSLLTEERKSIIKQNLQLFPNFSIIKAINGYDIDETINEFKKTKLIYKHLSPDPAFSTYGTLANFLTKYNILIHQISQKIPYICFIEDDLELGAEFIKCVEYLIQYFDTEDINSIRLDTWGEGYITSLKGAKNIINLINENGIIENIDNQLNYYCGPQIICTNTPWKLIVPTNAGDCLKTEKINIERLI